MKWLVKASKNGFTKLTISLDKTWIEAIDTLVSRGIFPSRTLAIQFMIYPAIASHLKEASDKIKLERIAKEESRKASLESIRRFRVM